MNMPCIVTLDLNRHLREMSAWDARDERAQELQEERRRYLLEDRPGLSLVTEALYVDEIGLPLDEALFALCEAWRRGAGVTVAAANLVVLIREKAERMARQWAGREVERELESARDYDADLPW